MTTIDLADIRFAPEKNLLDELFAQFDLENIVKHVSESDAVAPYHQLIIAQHVRLTPVMAPRLFRILDEVRTAIGFDEPVELYVHPQASINALAMHRLKDDKPHLVSVTSEMVRSMTDPEMCFALGHELGHLAFRHYRIMLVQAILASDGEESERRAPSIPQMLDRRLDKWGRLAELSADRVGFLACGSGLHTAVSAFFKMASGLGPEHLRFDLEAFLGQLVELQKLERREVMARFSHPVTPVRARALQLYQAAGGAGPGLAAADKEIGEIAALMDFEASTELASNARDFLLGGGLLAAHADGEPGDEEVEVLMKLLLQVTGDPELHLNRIGSVEAAEQLLDTACHWLVENAGQEKFVLLGQLCNIVAVDGRVSEAERATIMRIAGMLQVPDKAAKDILHQVLAGYVQKAATTAKKGFFGLGRHT